MQTRYAVKTHVFRSAGGRTVELLGPADPDALLDEPELESRFEADGYMPYWADLWPAAEMLADHLLTALPPATPDAPPVLEIGCGLGLAGLAAAARGYTVHFTDYDADALAFAEENARRNGVTDPQVMRLDFRQPPPRRYSLIIGSDVLYEPGLRSAVTAFLSAALAPGGRAVISDPDRRAVREWLTGPNLNGLACSGQAVVARSNTDTPVSGTIWELTSSAATLR